MIITKLSKNRIRIESEYGLTYTPSQQLYRVVECSCADLQNIEELDEQVEVIADMLSL